MIKRLISLCLVFAVVAPCVAAQNDGSKSGNSLLTEVTIDKESYVKGGIVGTVLGLGSGHVFQGRWQEKGWIFTSSEVLAGATMLVSLAPCRKDLTKNMDKVSFDRFDKCEKEYLIAGQIAFTGLRIWEIIDLWLTPNPGLKNLMFEDTRRQSTSRFNVAILPLGSKISSLQVTYKF
jgi:hypothetical protein